MPLIRLFVLFKQMTLKSLNDILGVLEQQAQWQEQPFPRVLKCWAEIVGVVVAAHARPVSIQRDVLWVATSSAAWSQNLTFGRQNLLIKLNKQLPTPLVDIRFSTASWQNSLLSPPSPPPIVPQEHPSYLGDDTSPHIAPTIANAKAVFEHWASSMQKRTQDLPLCPQCQCHTPPGELQRWGVCSPCAAKRL